MVPRKGKLETIVTMCGKTVYNHRINKIFGRFAPKNLLFCRTLSTKPMKRYILLTFCLFFGSMLANATPPDTTPVKIGVALPLTGEFATWGERIRQGFTLALEDVHHRIELDYQDEANCDAKASLSAVKKFSSVDNTKIWIMGCLAGTKAAGPLAKRGNALMLSTGLLDDEVYTLGYPVINLATQISTEAKFLAAHIQSRGLKKAAILHWPDAFGEEFGRALKEQFSQRSIESSYVESSIMGSDFRSIIEKIRISHADFIVSQLGDAQIQIFMKQMKELGMTLPVFSSYVVETNNAPTDILNGIEYAYPLNSSEGSPEKNKFDMRFESRFGGAPSANTYFAYDGLLLLDKAFDACQSSDTKCVLSFITKNARSGISGEVTYKSDGSSVRPYGIKKIENSKFIWLNKKVAL